MDGTGARQAIIDIGSNTVRLVIYGGPPRAPEVLYNEKVTARLGRGLGDTGQLSEKAMGQALHALARYALLLRLRGVTDVSCVATAAVRDAANGPAFLDRVAARGLAPRLLSGEEEAVIGAGGVCAAFPGATGVVGDLGGGSLELTDIANNRATHGVSLPLGTLRLARLREDGPVRFARRVRKMLRGADWAGAHGQTFYLVGGSWRALARLAMHRADWPIDDPHGFEMDPTVARSLLRSLSARKPAGAKVPAPPPDFAGLGISSARAANLPDAAALLSVLLRELKPARLVFSGWGLREGLLAARMGPAVRAADPLLEAVRAFAADHEPGAPALAPRLLGWTAAANPAGPESEALREAALLLALAGQRTEPNRRAAQALDWALAKRWVGLDTAGRAMLALAMRANAGRVAIPPALLRLAPAARLRAALAWGLSTRLARRFTLYNPAAMAETALRVEEGALVLRASPGLAALYTETTAKDLRLLADCLGLEPRFHAD
jgi:exopolyphosphatase/guanosine-5'-triphosphate,3'-diphosphate pyrophosphatase